MIEKLRENYNCDIPAVIVTADTSPAHIHRFERLNVPVLYKPVTHQTILATIQQLLTKAHTTYKSMAQVFGVLVLMSMVQMLELKMILNL